MDEYDIAIVGGGLVGTPLALALATGGRRVVLIERRAAGDGPATDPLAGESLDQRCTALSAGTTAWLDRHALWPALSDDACPIRTVHVSHRGRFGATRLEAAELGVDALGHVVENRAVLAALEARLAASDVRLVTGVAVASVEPADRWATVRYAVPTSEAAAGGGRSADGPSGHEQATGDAPEDQSRGEGALRARLVIGVDGVDSRVRAALGIAVRRHDYAQSAVLGAIRLERDHRHVAHERFTAGGPLALLPRPGRVVSFVECAAPEEAARIGALDDAAFLAHLQDRFGRRLGRFIETGPRGVMPLVRVEAERQVGPRTVLLGNAVRLLHPIAGQGYNLALRDVAALVAMLDADRGARGAVAADPGDAQNLASFAAGRRADQRRVVGLTDALARGFRGENAVLSHLRALALIGLDGVPPLRRRFARAAMGMT